MQKTTFIIFSFLAFVFIQVACSKPAGGGNNCANISVNCTGVAKSFATDVNPIIQSFCAQAGCHNSGSTNGPGPLLNHTQIANARVDIRCAVGTGVMPQNSTLTTSQKNSIICWIDSGAPDN